MLQDEPKRRSGKLSRQTIWRRKKAGLTQAEAEASRRRKPGPKPTGSKRARVAKPKPIPLTLTDLEHGACRIDHTDLRKLEVADESVELVLTDPPYANSAIPEWEALAIFANRVLKPGGHLVAYSGTSYLPQVLTSVSKCIPYSWTIALLHTDDQRSLVRGRWVVQHYKIVLVFRKRPHSPRRPHPDVILGGGKVKTHHSWQQALNESETLIDWFSDPGDTIVDPMVGSGTSAVACMRMGRQFIGGDVDPHAVEIARNRVIEEIKSLSKATEGFTV